MDDHARQRVQRTCRDATTLRSRLGANPLRRVRVRACTAGWNLQQSRMRGRNRPVASRVHACSAPLPRRLEETLNRACVASVCGVLLVASLARESKAGDLAETARFLAGKGVAADSSLAEHARTPSYAEYTAQITSSWKQFQQPNLEHMRTWWTERALAKYSTVFYPFSGPDIGNALAFFPDADSYLLFGLEPPGAIPDLRSMDDEAISSGLNELESSLSTILQVNYFFTKAMEKKLGKGSFNSITGLLVFFLAMSDCEVTGARRIAIGKGRIPGVEITFKRNGGKQQTVRYFMVNVADAELAKSAPDFLPYVKKQGRFATMIKSASYLLHKEGIAEPAHFAKIRSLILAQSDLVVQDDSGVPLRLFARDTWKLRFHGRYEAPTPEFAKYLEKDLRIEMQRNSTGKLPFSYGYAYKNGESNLMTAERAP
jgi:hypothetical protein